MQTPLLPHYEHEIGIRIGRGDFAGAAAVAARCRAAYPDASAGWLLGSIAALLGDDKETALALADERLARRPIDIPCLLQKAESLLALGRRADALAAAAAAAAIAAPNAAALDAVGEFLVHAGAHAQALAIYDDAVAAAPDDPSMHAKRAVVHRFLGNFDAAAADYERVRELAPSDPEALKGIAELRRQTAERNYVSALTAALAAAPSDSKEAATLHFALAKSCEDIGQHAESWRHLVAGNRIERSRIQYDSATDCAAIAHIIGAFPAVEAAQADTTGERPIFIVGLPRTGTTLVERIVGNHSAVHSAGELPALSEAIGAAVDRIARGERMDWLNYAAALGRIDGAFIAHEYLARARARRGELARFSDKQPTNFFYCALILRAFPDARIVHLTRHPLAACYAIYKTRFGGTYPFAYDLAELGEFYIAYRRLMAHWHTILPQRILDVAYEDVVTNLEPTTRRLLTYLDLPFEAACLEFHRNPRSTATASAVQVRQPLYDSSLQQWRHYDADLAALRAQLQAAGIQVE